MIQKLKDYWLYSRTIFLNVLALAAGLLSELLSWAVGVDWVSVFSDPRKAMVFTVVINVMNIVLRYWTTKPVGENHVTFVSADGTTVLPANSDEVLKRSEPVPPSL